MNFHFVFISYSVIYAKYSNCFEVPKEQPQRYFDGNEWKVMKPRPYIKPKVPRHLSLSVDLDWAEQFKEMKATEFEETTTQLPICDIASDTTKTEATAKRANTDKLTTKKTTNKITKKKITTKIISTPKIIMRAVSRIILRTTTAKTVLPHCRPLCKLKLKTTTTDPRLLHLKMSTSGDWRDNWNSLRPTRKPSPVTSKNYTPKVTTKCYIPTTKNVYKTTSRLIATLTKRPMSATKKTVTPCKRPVITTRKPVTSVMRPETTTMAPITKTEKNLKLSGKSADVANPTGNWPNLLKEFLKYVDEKKCQQPPCAYGTSMSTMALFGYDNIDKRKAMQEGDDLVNILMDGVEIENRLSDDASKSKEMFEYEGQRRNYESVEGSVSQMNNDYHIQGHKSLKNSIANRHDTGQLPKKIGYFKKFQRMNSKHDFTTSHNRESEIYSDQLKDKNESEDDDIFENYEFKSYPGALEANHAKKGYTTSRISRSDIYLDELTDKSTRKEDEVIGNNVLNYYINSLQHKHAKKENVPESSDSYLDGENIRQQEKDNYLHDETTETFNSKELNEIKDYASLNDLYPTELTSPTNNEDLLQDRDITFHLEDDSVKADKYSENRIGAHKKDIENDYAFSDLNELE